MDDIVIVVPEHLHQYALAIIPLLRERFAKKGVRLNERKFYDQSAVRGVEFLGSHIMPFRIHLNRVTVKRAFAKAENLNGICDKRWHCEAIMASVNSYTGLLKNRTEWKNTQSLKERIAPDWWEYLEWDERRQCVHCRSGFTWKDRMNEKYHLKLRRKNGKRRTNPAA